MKILIFQIFIRAVFLLAAALCCGIAIAQISRPGDQIPDALKEISPVSEVCRREGPKQGEKPISSSRIYEVDLQCSIGADFFMSMKSTGDSLFVDRRDATDFRSFHIEGAMNLGSQICLPNRTGVRRKSFWLEMEELRPNSIGSVPDSRALGTGASMYFVGGCLLG